MSYIIEPEVSGGFGKNTILDNAEHPPIVKYLHFEFQGWLGDDIVETFPCYLVSEKLKLSLENSDLTGFVIEECEISVSEYLSITDIPRFYWLKILKGDNVNNDFSIYSDYRLKLSEKAYKHLSVFNIRNCLLEKV